MLSYLAGNLNSSPNVGKDGKSGYPGYLALTLTLPVPSTKYVTWTVACFGNGNS